MANVVVVGSQWGDEGKGKIVDWLSNRADVVVRFQGGHNAGHTLVIDGVTYKMSLLPSGVVRPGKLSIIGNGVVLDPWALLDEIETVSAQGVDITPDNLRIADNAPLILPLHRNLDLAREEARGKAKIGTTGRGIGPAYEDKVARRAIRMADLTEPEVLDARVKELLVHHNALLRGFGKPEIDGAALVDKLKEVATRILPYAGNTWKELDDARRAGKRILFEGAHYVLGIVKAYTTRVGSGPFPTELHDDIGKGLGERGREFGTVTGRPRRCGWFDAVLVRQSVKVNGIHGIALTKLDVLDGVTELNVCTAYRIDGETVDHLPASAIRQAKVEPIYETVEGWSESTRGARSWAELPATTIKYVRRIEELIGAPVAMLSTSPEREDSILVHDPFTD